MFSQINEQIKAEFYQQNFPNDGQRFLAWYLRNIHLRDMNQTRDDITDGTDDKQIDAVIIDDDRETIYVLQGKFIGSERVDAEPLREVLSAWVQLKDLARLQEVGNHKLKRKLADIAKAMEDEYELCFELITTSALTPSAQNDLATFQKQLADLSEKEDIPSQLNLVDPDELRRRYDLALERDNPIVKHVFNLEAGKFMPMSVAGTQAIIAALPLRECITIPGIKDGTLFQKNVRQSLGLNNAVNKGIKGTIYGDKHRDFFFFHNGITAICNKMQLENGTLVVHGLSVVKPRDLRSNDKRVLNLKKAFEQKYPAGYLATKRGELQTVKAEKNKDYVLDLSDLGKYLIAWHSQRPNLSYSESRIFDKYFDQLFKRDREYKPEDAQALNSWTQEILKGWTTENPYALNEDLLAMKAYAPFHQLYAVSMCFAISNNLRDRVPSPSRCYEQAQKNGLVAQIVEIAATCLNTALEAASNEQQPAGRTFSAHNWIKAKACLANINQAIRGYFSMLPTLPGGKDQSKRLKEGLAVPPEAFEYRWAAD